MDIGRRLTLLILDVGDKRTAPIYWAGLTAVETSVLWCSISALNGPPSSTTKADTQNHNLKMMTALTEP
jgi:hypothetical protein